MVVRATRFGSRFWVGRVDRQTGSIMVVLHSLRRYQDSDRRMRVRLTDHMAMNETDLRAMRFLLGHRRAATPVTAGALAGHLGITTAATAKLIQRLGRAGHVEVSPNPLDHRSTHVTATASADSMVEQSLSSMHKRMYEVVRALSESDRRVVSQVLDELSDVMEGSLRQ